MIAADRTFLLKDGREAVLRSARPEDAKEIVEFLRQTAGESEFNIRSPEECGSYTVEGESAFIEKAAASPRCMVLLCRVGGRLAAGSVITSGKKIKTRHRAWVSLCVLREFWGLGIGSELMAEMERFAVESPQILQVELDVIDGNRMAMGLYEKCGFEKTGIIPDAVRLRDGSFRDILTMVKKTRKTHPSGISAGRLDRAPEK